MNADIGKIVDNIGRIILGKNLEIRLVLTCLLAKGHLLIEDIPGVGKTTLAQALAKTMGLNYNRIQFTSDLLPADIVGVSIFDKTRQEFEFHPGPLFGQMILADELNRATPRTQSALLEAMEERQVSVDGSSRPLPEPFFVIATQNQRFHVGTFPLPESQLDRFLMRIQLGYPDFQAERRLLNSESRFEMLKNLNPVFTVEKIEMIQEKVNDIHVSDAILDYVQAILSYSRSHECNCLGLSPRAGISLIQAAKSWALSEDREMVLPEDVQAVAGSVLEHRLNPEGSKVRNGGEAMTSLLIKKIPVPR